jgi:hypothetical protein
MGGGVPDRGVHAGNRACRLSPKVESEIAASTASLVVAWASRESARVDFELNGAKIDPLNFGRGGNALLRESVHAKYSYHYIDIPVAKLRRGENRLVQTQTRNESPACHVMYDHLALELPGEAPAPSEARR